MLCVRACTCECRNQWRQEPGFLELKPQVVLSPLIRVLRSKLRSSGKVACAFNH